VARIAYLGGLLWGGQWTEYATRLAQFTEDAENRNDLSSLATYRMNHGALSLARDDVEQAERDLHRALALQSLGQLGNDRVFMKYQQKETAPGAPRSVYVLLATAYFKLGQTNEEYEVLSQLAAKDDDCTDAYLRLMEIASGSQKWPVVEQNARRYLAVNPLLASPYHYLAQASEEKGDTQTAIDAYRALLQLEAADPAAVHYRLARALHKRGDPEARRQVLQALEEAPRYREALGLLLEINGQTPRAQNRAATEATP
jgi:tetratricopeptide (TPR) repeat protein